MPWSVDKDDRCPADKPWAVTNKDTNRLVACHPSQDAARQQQKALYANVPESDSERADNNDSGPLIPAPNPLETATALADRLDNGHRILSSMDPTNTPDPVVSALDHLTAGKALCDQLIAALQDQTYLIQQNKDRVAQLQRADADDDPKALAAALDAILDAAMTIVAGVDRRQVPPEVAQLVDLVVAADNTVDKLMVVMNVFDPDGDDERALLDRSQGLPWLIQFNYRSDGGPLLVGTFPSRDAAYGYVHDYLEPFESGFSVFPISAPQMWR